MLAVDDHLLSVRDEVRDGVGDHLEVLLGRHGEDANALLVPRLGDDTRARRGAVHERAETFVGVGGDTAAAVMPNAARTTPRARRRAREAEDAHREKNSTSLGLLPG